MALTLTVSCSDDDNAGDGTITLNAANLVEKSPFNYVSYDLIEVVDDGGTSLTTDQLVANIRSANSSLAFSFLENNTVRVTLGSNVGNFDFSASTTQINITQTGQEPIQLQNVKLYSDGRLTYESTNFDGDSRGEAELRGRFTFN
jgi:hypothetical protein